MLELGIACLAAVLAAVAIARAYVPPQQRSVRELLVRVAELENDYAELAGRLTNRQRKEGMEKARTAHEERKARRDAVEEHAAQILAAAKPGAQQQSTQFDYSTAEGRAVAKQFWRSRAPWTSTTKQ
jgi:hypothetical protein